MESSPVTTSVAQPIIACFTLTPPPLLSPLHLERTATNSRASKTRATRHRESKTTAHSLSLSPLLSNPTPATPVSFQLLRSLDPKMSNHTHYRFSLLFCFIFIAGPASALTAASDAAALAALKAAVSPSTINPWSCLASWNFTSDPCRPSDPTHFVCGLSCSADATRVTSIALDPAGYSAALPSSLSNLTRLTHLNLADNSFRGAIPAIPSLQTLILSSNAFSGQIPPSLSALLSLQTLDLSRNSLAGEIPGEFARLSALVALDLSFNRLSGTIPSALPPNLVELALRGNSLTGTLKRSAFQPLARLEVAELSVNRLEGRVEGWFLMLPSLQQVNLANNSLTGMDAVMGRRRGGGERLVAVDLGFNRIEGELPAGLAAFPSLAALSVRHNRMRGAIPWEYLRAKKGAPFRRLFLDGNFLKGRVAPELLRDVAGSFGDNCLDGCPPSLPLCSPMQKPKWVCG